MGLVDAAVEHGDRHALARKTLRMGDVAANQRQALGICRVAAAVYVDACDLGVRGEPLEAGTRTSPGMAVTAFQRAVGEKPLPGPRRFSTRLRIAAVSRTMFASERDDADGCAWSATMTRARPLCAS